MRIVDIRETAIPLRSDLKNSSFDFSEMTTSIVAVITDVMRSGRPVIGFAFNSTGRYACGAQMRERFIPRILRADPPLHRLLAERYSDGWLSDKVFCYVGGGWYWPGQTITDLQDEMRRHLAT